MHRSRFFGPRTLPPWLFDDAAGGIEVSGDSGSGKSTLLAALMVALAVRGFGFTLLDPHGDLARLLRRVLLSLGEPVRRRLHYVCPSDVSVVTALNPLAVEREGIDDYTWRARLTVKVAHVARILLAAWGETDFNGKPLLFKWTTRLLRSLALIGLPVSEVRHFLDIGSPLYSALSRAVPDLLAQREFAELACLRPRDREEFIASTKNRFLGFLENVTVETALSRVDGVLSARKLIEESAIVLIDLAPRGVLREEDQEILGNLWLNEFLHAIYHTPDAERVPSFLFIDELPVFRSCSEQLTAALRQVRKMRCRIIAAHQGTQFFGRQTEDPLLHAFIGQCGTHFYFRHIDPVDAKFFGEILALPSLDPRRIKHVLTQTQQYQDGHDLVILEDAGASTSAADQAGGSEATGVEHTSGWSRDSARTTTRATGTQHSQTRTEGETTDEETLRKTVSAARAEASGTSASTSEGVSQRQGESRSTGTTNTSASTWSHTRTHGTSRTFRQTLVPRLRWREVVTSIQFFSTEEQIMEAARRLACLKTGHALLYVAGAPVAEVRVPLVQDPYARTPLFGERTDAGFRQRLLQRPGYALPGVVQEERQRFLDVWLTTLQAVPVHRPFSTPLESQTRSPRGGCPSGNGSPLPGGGPAGETASAPAPDSPFAI